MLQSLAGFLFKYRPVVFERGDLTFTAPWPVSAAVVSGLALIGVTAVMYARVPGAATRTDRLALIALRAGAIAVLAFALTGPALMIATVVPQQNFLGVLIDDSRSMQIADAGGRRRGAAAADAFAEDGALLRALGERFKVRLFRFSETVSRLDSTGALAYAGRRTDIGGALESVRRDLSAVPLAGLVLLTDGGDNAGSSLTDPLLRLKADRVPVHVVGLGSERFDRDIEIGRVETPRSVLQGTSVAVEVTIRHAGYGGRTVMLNVEDEGRIVSTREVRLPREGESATVRAHFTVIDPGARVFRFAIPTQDGEALSENNTVEALIDVADRREKILYFEGEPRFEVKFLRRAIDGDPNLHVVTLQRTAENKFLRLDVEDSTELVAGFPRTRRELFQYRGLILGSVEASFFTHDQLRMIAEFVSVRGGGLLALGGRNALGEGGYADTPLADALPVVLEATPAGSQPFFRELSITPTPFGRAHPVTQLRPTPEASQRRWDSLPPLSMLNPITAVKPGASTLLRGDADGGPYVVLASQRYGRGKAIAFPVQDSWLWQMHADIPLEDMTHETLWRQLLRWLVSGVADQVMLTASEDRVDPGREVVMTAVVSDSGYLRRNGADVMATITDPTGEERTIPMQWTVERDGEYQARFTPEMDGRYRIDASARQGATSLGLGTTFVEAGDVGTEYFDATMRSATLRRIAEETGGQFYTEATMDALPEDVSFTESGATVYEQRDLWDMPILLFLLIGLVAAEWTLRRARGLA
ncbi:MAG TPA: hypothetical protein VGA37_10500 [Gemmatimonadales bacterium]